VTSIGPHLLRNRVLLAPMAGITDAPFRAIAWAAGAGYVASEMLTSQDQLWATEKSRLRRQWVEGIEPRVVQLAGSEPAMVAEAARRHWEDGAQIIDLNFGCPAKKVCRRAAGSQLLREPALVAEIAAAAVQAVPVPVTVKMRTGWSRETTNGVEVARRLEQVGVAAITVHGRSRACFFEGAAEYDTIAAIKASVGVPVFANGDIDSPDKARQVLEQTAADGVMIGRAALGAPWLLGEIADPEQRTPGVDERWRIILEHVAALHEFYGEPGVRIARKHVQWYLGRLPVPDGGEVDVRAAGAEFNRLVDPTAQLDLLASLRERWCPVRRAA
jgi:tRNA-dihydrouridine synthase B